MLIVVPQKGKIDRFGILFLIERKTAVDRSYVEFATIAMVSENVR